MKSNKEITVFNNNRVEKKSIDNILYLSIATRVIDMLNETYSRPNQKQMNPYLPSSILEYSMDNVLSDIYFHPPVACTADEKGNAKFFNDKFTLNVLLQLMINNNKNTIIVPLKFRYGNTGRDVFRGTQYNNSDILFVINFEGNRLKRPLKINLFLISAFVNNCLSGWFSNIDVNILNQFNPLQKGRREVIVCSDASDMFGEQTRVYYSTKLNKHLLPYYLLSLYKDDLSKLRNFNDREKVNLAGNLESFSRDIYRNFTDDMKNLNKNDPNEYKRHLNMFWRNFSDIYNTIPQNQYRLLDLSLRNVAVDERTQIISRLQNILNVQRQSRVYYPNEELFQQVLSNTENQLKNAMESSEISEF